MLASTPLMSSNVPTRTPSNCTCKGYMSRILSTPIGVPVRCVSHAEVHRTVASCMRGIYNASATAMGDSSTTAEIIPTQRTHLLTLMCHTLGNDNAWGRGIVWLG